MRTWKGSLDKFRTEYEQDFRCEIPPLLDLAMEYHRRCEAYDRTVCTGPIGRDGIMPAGYREMALISRHSAWVLAEFTETAIERGLTRRDLLETIQQYNERGEYSR